MIVALMYKRASHLDPFPSCLMFLCNPANVLISVLILYTVKDIPLYHVSCNKAMLSKIHSIFTLHFKAIVPAVQRYDNHDKDDDDDGNDDGEDIGDDDGYEDDDGNGDEQC